MAVRNFWLEADIDGRKTMLAGGPRSKGGGMTITLYQREEGGIKKAVTIRCREKGGKMLTTDVYVHNGLNLVTEFVTKR